MTSTRPALPRFVREAGQPDQLTPLSDSRQQAAYVLLGDPGAGKSTSFDEEARALGETPLAASDVVTGLVPTTGFADRTVFIDGLDQIKAGATEPGLGALRQVRTWLNEARPLAFRVSCREADWLGDIERSDLAKVARDGEVKVLRLEPLTQVDILRLLAQRQHELGDPLAFWQAAEARQLTALLGNPLLLELLGDAVIEQGGTWPHTRTEVYEAACRLMLREHSLAHPDALTAAPGREARRLHTAGLLCAVLLLSGKTGIGLQAPVPSHAVNLDLLPAELPLPDARAVLASKLFVAPHGIAQARHRSIAEFLAARAFAQCLTDGLPLERLLSLLLGFDGQPVEALRGLLAWLVPAHLPSTDRLMRIDPVGFVLNGDPAQLGTQQRLSLLAALGDQAKANPWFRQDAWQSHPFGPLATADMADDYLTQLAKPERDLGHQAFIDCLLDALLHGEPMPTLAPALAVWVDDPQALMGHRVSALMAWQRHCPEPEQAAQERRWLDAALALTWNDPTDRLLGLLLCDAYPERVGPDEVLRYLRQRPHQGEINRYTDFWPRHLLERSRPGDAAVLVRQWLQRFPEVPKHDPSRTLRSLAAALLARALEESGDELSVEELFGWLSLGLGLGLDGYGSYHSAPNELQPATQWLQARPQRLVAVLRWGYEHTPLETSGSRHFWWTEQRLLGAALPRDHLAWWLQFIAGCASDALAEHGFARVVHELVEPSGQFDAPSLEALQAWATQNASAQRPYLDWLEARLFCAMDDERGQQRRDGLDEQARHQVDVGARRAWWASRLESLNAPTPEVHLLHHFTLAIQGHFIDVHGESALERAQDLMGVEADQAHAALAALDRTLERPDLPSFTDVLADSTREAFPIRYAALTAAQRVFSDNAQQIEAWGESLCQTLVAFHLTDALDQMPAWYRWLVQHRAGWVAPVFIAFVSSHFLRRAPHGPTGLWALAREDDHVPLTHLVLPSLLRAFPLRASAPMRRELNTTLLAALPRLAESEAADIIATRLSGPAMNPYQQLAWEVAALRYSAQGLNALEAKLAQSRSRRIALAVAIREQGLMGAPALPDEPRTLSTLIRLLAPITPQRVRGGVFRFGDTEQREDLVRGLFNRLAQHPSREAGELLLALAGDLTLGDWQPMAAYSRQAQQSVARQTRFVLASPEAVALTLANRAPAHVPDLKALLLDHLKSAEAELRGANSFALTQFWMDAQAPRLENDCTQLLLEKLRTRLAPLGVAVDPEVKAADHKRMDLKLSVTRPGRPTLALPVEAKRDSNGGLWTAWREQLQQLYAIDPQAGGHGVYLVYWFGQPVRGAEPPATNAAELKAQLEALLSPQDRALLAIHVLDLSLPQSTITREAKKKTRKPKPRP